MTEKDYGVVTESGAVRFERLLPGPVERVWAYLTESEKRATWFAGGSMELHVGGQVEFVFQNSALSDEPVPEKYRKYEGQLGRGRVLACEQPRLLSFTWADGSEVSIELTPKGKDVLLVLSHRRLASRDAMMDVSGGWHSHLDLLLDLLYGRRPRPFWANVIGLEPEYRRRLA
jgi:uncharacterized protein YndB with AHSA1/START domain